MKATIRFYSILILSLTFIIPSEAKGKAKTQDPDEVLHKGREAFFNYEFEEAENLYEQYEVLQKKAKKSLDPELEDWQRELEIAVNAFDRVQRITIVDSIEVRRDDFFKAYKLSDSAGKIIRREEANSSTDDEDSEISFISEDGDFRIEVVPDDNGELRLQEIYVLLDRSKEIFESLEGDFEKEGDYAFPFMSADGQTLYFANNGSESMGGYDIFVAQKDPLTGEYLQPLNMGMPFNSPYDDIMMAVDEEKGTGWWATDRNSNDGFITIYIYRLEDMRRNYSPDTDGLEIYARYPRQQVN